MSVKILFCPWLWDLFGEKMTLFIWLVICLSFVFNSMAMITFYRAYLHTRTRAHAKPKLT